MGATDAASLKMTAPNVPLDLDVEKDNGARRPYLRYRGTLDHGKSQPAPPARPEPRRSTTGWSCQSGASSAAIGLHRRASGVPLDGHLGLLRPLLGP